MTLFIKKKKKKKTPKHYHFLQSSQHFPVIAWKVPIMSSELYNLQRHQGSSLIRYETQKAKRHHEITQVVSFSSSIPSYFLHTKSRGKSRKFAYQLKIEPEKVFLTGPCKTRGIGNSEI